MRITSGIYKNRKLISPENGLTHPMGERERIALFNILGADITEANVADVYAGTGALGLEALSRGAHKVVFVDNNREAIVALRRNITELGVPAENYEIIKAKVDEYCDNYRGDGYDIVLADPPYDKFDAAEVAKLTDIIIDGGTLVLSHPGVAPELLGFTAGETRSYAGANLTFYHKK